MPWSLSVGVDRARTGPADLRETLAREMPAGLRTDDVLLIVTELVTNAILHGDGPIRASLVTHDRSIRVEVADGRTLMGPPSEQSRGLRLVAAIASSWGVDRRNVEGKIVWAELPVPGAA